MRSLTPALISLLLLWLFQPITAVADDPPKAAVTEKVEEKEKPVSIFADKQLESVVRAQVFAKRYSNDPIIADDVANISRVVGKGKDIKTLDGLQHCKNVMLLDLADNRIVDLAPLAELKRLQSVTLAKNEISNIEPLADLTSMQLLDLSNNRITDLSSIGSMQNLRTLYVADNKLTKLDPISPLTKLWSLDVSGNPIRQLDPVAKLSWLTMLDFHNTNVISLKPLIELRKLDMILMSGSKVTDLKPLVEMCRKDFASERRFSPYLEIYLGNNPLDEKSKVEQIEELRSFGVDVYDE